MAKRQGTYILLGYMDGDTFTPFAYAKSCDYDLGRDFQEVSSPSTGEAKEYIPMRYGWTMSCKCMLSDDNSTVIDAFLNKTLLTLQWRDATILSSAGTSLGTYETLQGTAYIKDVKATAQLHEMASFSISFQGTGAVTRTLVSGTKSTTQDEAGDQ